MQREKQRKANMGYQGTKLDHARSLRGIYFIDPKDEEFKDIMKNARRKLEIPMPAAMPCKTPLKNSGETYRGIGKSKTKYACIVEAEESTRIRLEGVPCRYHEDHIAGKGINSLNHYNLVHKFVPVPQGMKIPHARAVVENNGKNFKDTSMEAHESQRSEGRKVHFASLMDLCRLKKSELEPKFQKYKSKVVLRGDVVNNDSGSYAVFTEQGSSASQMKATKIMDIVSRLPGCAGQAPDAVSAYTQVKMEDAPTLLKIPKSECPNIWIHLPKHKWPEQCTLWKIWLFLLNEISTDILWQDYYGKGTSRKFF